uniref:hypothetical protein n=1 Tax=Dyadobacter sp. MSC1_007 TaxID=2909264 RepID=UPI00202E51D9
SKNLLWILDCGRKSWDGRVVVWALLSSFGCTQDDSSVCAWNDRIVQVGHINDYYALTQRVSFVTLSAVEGHATALSTARKRRLVSKKTNDQCWICYPIR